LKNEQEIYSMIDKYIEEIVATGSPEKPVWNQEMIRQNATAHWNYIDGCMITALMKLYESSGDKKYLDFCDSFIDYFIDDQGGIRTYEKDTYNLDNIKEGSVLFNLYDNTGKEKYRRAMDTLYAQLMEQPRTREGNFWHKQIYPGQIWLDGLYMAQPFYVEYEKRYNNKKNYSDSLKQYRNVSQVLKNKDTGLYYHAYDSSRQMFWCNKETGLSANYWLRALGWFVMSMVDVMELLDETEDAEFYETISEIFKDLVNALLRYQDSSGMWYQVVDRGDEERNYLETSGSSIISYAILKAVQQGILSRDFATRGKKAFMGICKKYLYQGTDGKMNLGGTVLVGGLGYYKEQRRDGSFDYYMSEPVVENEAKGIAPFLLAYIYLKQLGI